MNIYWYETKKQLGTSLWWILTLAFFIWACVAFFEAIANDAMMEVIDQFPDALKKAFGMDMDISKILGYFAFIAIFVYLCGAIFACNLGLNAVSVEERDLTADFLVSKPVTRNRILSLKILSGLTHITLLTVCIGLMSVVSVELYKSGQTYSKQALFLIILGLFLFQLLFYSLGLLISVLLKKMESPLPFSLGISFGLYMLDTFDTLLEDTFLRYLIPFDYFDIRYIVDNAAYKTYGIIISLALITVYTTGTYLLYNRRNIPTAM